MERGLPTYMVRYIFINKSDSWKAAMENVSLQHGKVGVVSFHFELLMRSDSKSVLNRAASSVTAVVYIII